MLGCSHISFNTDDMARDDRGGCVEIRVIYATAIDWRLDGVADGCCVGMFAAR